MDAQTINLVLVFLMIVFVIFAIYARLTHKDASNSTSPDITARILDLTDQLALIALGNAAKTPTLLDDDASMIYLQARGWTVTGSPETGYVATREPPHVA